MWLTDRLVKTFIPRPGQVDDPQVRFRYGALEAWVSIVINTLMAGAKLGLGLWVNSIALIADAGHTLSDTLTSGVVLLGFRTARKPSDLEHPHGHGRMESVSTLIIATLLAVVGLEFLWQSISRLIRPVPVQGNWIVVAALVLAAAVKEWMARFSIALGRTIHSSALEADAWHHRTDAIASVLVAVGIAGVAFGHHGLDGVFGIGVSLLIVYAGIELIHSSASYLIGEAPAAAVVRQVGEAALSVPGVVSFHDIEVHDYGTTKDVSIHIVVDSSETVTKAHEIATAVEEAVGRRLRASTVVHVDPLDTAANVARAREVRAGVAAILRGVEEVEGFHAVTVAGTKAGKGIIHFHVLVDRRMDVGRSHALSHELAERIRLLLPGYEVTIHVEPYDAARARKP